MNTGWHNNWHGLVNTSGTTGRRTCKHRRLELSLALAYGCLFCGLGGCACDLCLWRHGKELEGLGD